MKYRAVLITLIGVLIFSGVVMLARTQLETMPLELSVTSDKTKYKLGEVVQLNFELKNMTERNVTINEAFGTGAGSLTVHISKDGRNFPEYNPGWGFADYAPMATVIKPNESIRSSASVFWHRKPNALQGQNSEMLNDVSQKTLITNLAFPKPGKYFIKAVFKSGVDNIYRTLESAPIEVTVEEPDTVEDVEVWNAIKDDEDLTFFMQFGHTQIPSFKTEEQARFLAKVENLIKKHPNSFYGENLRQSLAKFNAAEKKRKAMLEKLKPGPPR